MRSTNLLPLRLCDARCKASLGENQIRVSCSILVKNYFFRHPKIVEQIF